jgi:MFS family permease
VSGYLALLRLAPVRRMLLAAFLSRAPTGIVSLATVVYLRQEGHSFAVAGLVGGMVGFGIAVSAVLQARIISRRGQTSLVALAVAFALLALGLIVGGAQDWPAVPLALIGLGVGASLPATSSIVRGLYPGAVSARPELERGVFALDSALTDSTYIAGPALVAFTVAVASAAVAIGAAIVAALCSVATLLRTHLSPPPRQEVTRPSSRRPSYPRSVKLLAVAQFPLGLAFGIEDVAFPAFATDHHHLALSGVLLAIGGVASAGAGLIYGTISDRVATTSVLVRGAWAYPFALALPAFGTTFVTMFFLTVPAGLVTGCWVSARNHFINVVAPAEVRTSANGWVLLSVYLGTSVGLVISGAVVAAVGWREALIVGAALSIAIPAITLLARSTFHDPSTDVQATIPRSGTELPGLLTEEG